MGQKIYKEQNTLYKINIQQMVEKDTVGHTEFQACEVFPLGETMKQESLASDNIKY
ncbi:MAG: hypothetical protein ISS82_04015 [Nanoarchaeota archaeon]|nr:hypothetical protein [Nanoarchaeota archaeon]